MAACAKTRDFFLEGHARDYDKVLEHYDKALRLKAESKSSKPDNVVKLDKWYQNELPKKIKSRGKDAHLTHEELVQTIKWKLARGKFRPNLTNLVQMNTPRVAMQETKKAFRNAFKKQDLGAAVAALCNLKGVGPAMASAVLAAGAPHLAPFMADECLLAMPDCDSTLDYTMKEYMKYVDVVNKSVERLNGQGGKFDCHKVEKAVWTHYILNDLKPDLLQEILGAAPAAAPAPAAAEADAVNGASEESNQSAESAESAKAPEAEEVPAASNGEATNGSSSSHATNGNGNSEAAEEQQQKTNGTSEEPASSTPEVPESESAPAPEADSAVAKAKEAVKEQAVEEEAAPAEPAVPESAADNDTNDSTKENKEASAATKRPLDAGESDQASAAAPAESSEAAAGASPASDEPAQKKMKADGDADAAPSAAAAAAMQQQQQQAPPPQQQQPINAS